MASSDLYNTLEAAAKEFLESCQPNPTGTNKPDAERILSNLTPDFRIDFGHSYFIASAQHLQGHKTGQGFVDHMSGMAAHLQTWSIQVTDSIVDVSKRKVMLRGNFHMTPKGQPTVLNDIILTMTMNTTGDKLVACTEFVDPVASAEIGRLIQAGPQQ